MSALLTNESGFHGVVHPPRLHCSPRSLCLTSEPVVMILVWVFLVGCVSSAFQYTFIFAIPARHHDHFIPAGHDMSFIYFTCFYAFMALMMSFYPVTGYMADVCCGRYRMVSISLVFIWISLILVIAGAVLSSHDHHSPLHVLEIVLLALATLIVIPGLSGFYSNVTQLGLDQLQDSPSHTLGVFLHWCVWVNLLGGTAIHTAFVFVLCLENGPHLFNNALQQIGYYTPGIPFILLSIFLVLNYFTRRWFVATNAQYNPYKIVVNILRYVRTHKHPTRHSALHWTNGERPSRFDFAKVCYGGPFTSSQVEDVKTFGRIVLMLLTIGPVFILNVPTSYYLFPIFSFHVDGRHTSNCSANWIFVDSGTMSYLVGLVCLPILMWVIYCVLKNKIPKILTRLEIGIVMSILGVLSMLLIELAGHYFSTSKESNHCIFIETYTNKYYTLEFPWYILIVPNCLNVFSYNLVLATTFEFISAQTPQPMKGLVFGVLFAIKGGFNFLGAVFLIPFSLKIVTNLLSRYISCGFGYFFVTLIVSLIGLILFVCASKRYKYRVRDEEPFPQSVVEEIYERRLQYNDESLDSPDIVPGDVESIAGNHGDSVRDTQRQKSVGFVKRSEDSVICKERVGSEGAGSLLSMSHDWYGTFQYSDSERRK